MCACHWVIICYICLHNCELDLLCPNIHVQVLSMDNPNIQFNCALCGSHGSPTIKGLMEHMSLTHSNEPRFNIQCGLFGCGKTIKTYSNFKSHVYRDHDFHTKTLNNKTDTSKFSLQCAICSKKNHENNESWKFKNASSYLSHMKHHMTNNDCPVTCPVSQCTSTYTVYKSLTSHISRFHKGFDVINAKAELKLSKSQDQIDN